MKILISICARGGSKGIPGKNIKPLANLPLIAYTIRFAQEFSLFFPADIALSTDDDEIKKVAENYGLPSGYTRPVHLATDSAGKIDVLADLLETEEKRTGIKYDYLIDLDVTSPLRTIKDVSDAFETIRSDHEALNLFSVNKAARNPYFNMVEKKDNGYYSLVMNKTSIVSRQSAPPVYDMNASFYIYRRAFFDMNCKTVFTDKSLIYEMPHICFDLDHLVDFEFMDFLLVNKKLNFSI